MQAWTSITALKKILMSLFWNDLFSRKPKVKIKFTDFWPGFSPSGNYFFQLLSQDYKVELSESPDMIIYSCFGNDFEKYDCIKVFYTGENIRPDFSACDFAISFDYNEDPRHYRLPLYALYIDKYKALPALKQKRTKKEAEKIWKRKTGFCCMVVSNPDASQRLDFFEKLSVYKKVDSGGNTLNNIGEAVADKMDFIKDYRFVIAFENASYPGYTTEKIVEPLIADCIPLYWGDPLVGNDFNKKRFLQLDHDSSQEAFIQKIIQIDNNEEMAINMLMEPAFNNSVMPYNIKKKSLIFFLKSRVLSKLL